MIVEKEHVEETAQSALSKRTGPTFRQRLIRQKLLQLIKREEEEGEKNESNTQTWATHSSERNRDITEMPAASQTATWTMPCTMSSSSSEVSHRSRQKGYPPLLHRLGNKRYCSTRSRWYKEPAMILLYSILWSGRRMSVKSRLKIRRKWLNNDEIKCLLSNVSL